MRVLMFGWEFPPFQAGGLATATLGLVQGLLNQGVAVTLVVPFPADRSAVPGLRLVSAAERTTELKRRYVPSPVRPYDNAEEYAARVLTATAGRTTGTGAVYGRNLIEEVDRLARVAGEIAAEEPHDLIDTHDWITFGAGLRAREVSGRPLVAHIHATEFDRSGPAVNPEIFDRESRGLHGADRVIANSEVLRRQVVEGFGVDPARVDVVHWGVRRDDEHRPEPAPIFAGHPVVVFVGRVTRQKGPDYFVDAARRIADFVPGVRFVMAGHGDLLPRMIDRAAELGLADRFHFTGGIGPDEVRRIFRAASVCVMPSVSEPFGLVALESLLNGTPCVMPRDAGVSEVVRNAFKVDFWDVEEMTNKVVAILEHPELHRELRERGLRELAEPRFGLDEPARRTAEAYRRALAQGR